MKILVRLPNWLGDVVMSTAFITAVKQVYPDAVVDVIIKKELSGIAALIPGLRTIHQFSKAEFKGLGGAYRFGKALRAENYDLFFNLPASISSATLAWATGAKERVGYGSEGGFFLLTNALKKPLNLHRVDEYIYLLEKFSGESIGNREVKLAVKKSDAANVKRVIVNFNSEAASRRMPLDKGRELINLLAGTFTDTRFTFIGTPKETIFVSQFIIGSEHADRLEDYAGATDLPGLAQLMADSVAVLTTDSGPAHLANSVGAPVIVLFGAGNESNTAPYNQRNLNVLRAGKLTCEPCVKNTCRLYGIPKCMQLLDDLHIINRLSLYLPHA
ncbi:glycosyltransferase family 9 protein [soil metagenome]|jgi:ADP-heptose:LPS heptosyltransferase